MESHRSLRHGGLVFLTLLVLTVCACSTSPTAAPPAPILTDIHAPTQSPWSIAPRGTTTTVTATTSPAWVPDFTTTPTATPMALMNQVSRTVDPTAYIKAPDSTPDNSLKPTFSRPPTAVLVPATTTPTESPPLLYTLPPPESAHQEQLQVGLNFIRFYWHDETGSSREGSVASRMDYVQPEAIFKDFRDLEIHAFRQFIKADLLWDKIEPHNDQWELDRADEVITTANLEPIVTLFRLQYASPTPPWITRGEDFQRTLGPDAEDYLRRLVNRYGEHITYWELGNEMHHWTVAYDPSASAYERWASKLPAHSPAVGFSPQDQGIFLKQVAEFIRKRDLDAVIVLPGAALTEIAGDWLEEVIKGAGSSDWFDVVNYHFYGSWQRHKELRPRLDEKLKELGIDSKSVWLTETGSTSSATLKVRTDYPNSDESQCADVFRRIVQGYAFGDEFVSWHTYIGSTGEGNDWRDYGLRDPDGRFKPSYYAFRLLVEELIPFETVQMISGMPESTNLYLITLRGGVRKYVAWGEGYFEIPMGVRELTSVFPNNDGSFNWKDVSEGSVIELFDLPVLLR